MKYGKLWSVLIVFLVALGLRIYWGSQKQGLHVDEALSVVLATYSDYGWKTPYPESQMILGKEVKKLTFGDDSSWKGAARDITHLWWKTRDKAHSNYYYSLLRVCFIGINNGDISSIIIRGLCLQLFLFGLAFLACYHLLQRIFSDFWQVLIGLVVAFWSAGSISNTLLLREYQLQGLMLLLLAWGFVVATDAISHGRLIGGRWRMFFSSFVLALTLLSGYFTIAFVAAVLAYLLFKSWRFRQKENIRHVVGCAVLTGVIVNLCYTHFLSGFFSSRSSQAAGNMHLVESLTNWFVLMERYQFHLPILAILLLVISLGTMGRRKNMESTLQWKALLVVLALGWSLLAMLLAPFKMLRYIVAAFPLIGFVVPLFLSPLHARVRIIAGIGIAACLLFYSFHTSRIETLYNEFPAQQVYRLEPDVPVLVRNQNLWKYGSIVPYFDDTQRYQFFNSDSLLQNALLGYQDVFVLQEGGELQAPAGYAIQSSFLCGNYFVGYRIRRI